MVARAAFPEDDLGLITQDYYSYAAIDGYSPIEAKADFNATVPFNDADFNYDDYYDYEGDSLRTEDIDSILPPSAMLLNEYEEFQDPGVGLAEEPVHSDSAHNSAEASGHGFSELYSDSGQQDWCDASDWADEDSLAFTQSEPAETVVDVDVQAEADQDPILPGAAPLRVSPARQA